MLRHLLVLLLVLALGLASRLAPIGWPLYDHSLGDVLYAVAAYLALALVRPRWPPERVALVALGWCLLVEAFQATDVPARFPPLLRWLIGTTFSWHDILCYLVGVAGVVLLDAAVLRSRPRAD